jgi:hypothetical protein
MGYFASCAVEIVASSYFGAPLLRCYSKKGARTSSNGFARNLIFEKTTDTIVIEPK